MTYEEKAWKLEKQNWAFQQTPLYHPYLTPAGIVYIVTWDPYTNPKYHEQDVERWGIWYGKPQPNNGKMSVAHGKGKLAKFFDSPEEAQLHLDWYAAQKGWKIIERPAKEETGNHSPKESPGSLLHQEQDGHLRALRGLSLPGRGP